MPLLINPAMQPHHRDMLLRMEFFRVHYPEHFNAIMNIAAGILRKDAGLGRWGFIHSIQSSIHQAGDSAQAAIHRAMGQTAGFIQHAGEQALGAMEKAFNQYTNFLKNAAEQTGAAFTKAYHQADTYVVQHKQQIIIAAAVVALAAGAFFLGPAIFATMGADLSSIVSSLGPTLTSVGEKMITSKAIAYALSKTGLDPQAIKNINLALNVAEGNITAATVSVATPKIADQLVKAGLNPKDAAAFASIASNTVAATNDPTLDGVATSLGNSVVKYVDGIGAAKIMGYINGLVAGKPITSTQDPRLYQGVADLQTASGNPTDPHITAAVASSMIANQIDLFGIMVSPTELYGGLALLLWGILH